MKTVELLKIFPPEKISYDLSKFNHFEKKLVRSDSEGKFYYEKTLLKVLFCVHWEKK